MAPVKIFMWMWFTTKPKCALWACTVFAVSDPCLNCPEWALYLSHWNSELVVLPFFTQHSSLPTLALVLVSVLSAAVFVCSVGLKVFPFSACVALPSSPPSLTSHDHWWQCQGVYINYVGLTICAASLQVPLYPFRLCQSPQLWVPALTSGVSTCSGTSHKRIVLTQSISLLLTHLYLVSTAL